MAARADRSLNGDRVPGESALAGPSHGPRRSGEGRGKPLDGGSTEPIVVEIFGGGLCPAVDVSQLR
jgi:hypothetical protein